MLMLLLLIFVVYLLMRKQKQVNPKPDPFRKQILSRTMMAAAVQKRPDFRVVEDNEECDNTEDECHDIEGDEP